MHKECLSKLKYKEHQEYLWSLKHPDFPEQDIQLIFTYQNSEFKCLALVSIYKINNDMFK